jgi:hypothetical protein
LLIVLNARHMSRAKQRSREQAVRERVADIAAGGLRQFPLAARTSWCSTAALSY